MSGYSKISSATDPSDNFISLAQTPKEEGERFGVILGRSSSVSSASATFMMKRAFSLRRSSSVSERYCRIHDQSSPIHDADIVMGGRGTTRRSIKKNSHTHSHKGGKILKACKRLLGL